LQAVQTGKPLLNDQGGDIRADGVERGLPGEQPPLLVYDETMEPVSSDEQQAIRAITLAEYREWPERLD
jgi:hypothetical protein